MLFWHFLPNQRVWYLKCVFIKKCVGAVGGTRCCCKLCLAVCYTDTMWWHQLSQEERWRLAFGLLQPKLTLTCSYSFPLPPSLSAALTTICSWRWPSNWSSLTKPPKTSLRKRQALLSHFTNVTEELRPWLSKKFHTFDLCEQTNAWDLHFGYALFIRQHYFISSGHLKDSSV